MNKTPKGKCRGCGKRFRLELRGTNYVVPSHNLRIAGQVNPECPGTGRRPQ